MPIVPITQEKAAALNLYLYFGSLVADDPGHCSQGGELIGRYLGVNARKVAQQGGLPHRRKPHKPDTGITRFGHVETWMIGKADEEIK